MSRETLAAMEKHGCVYLGQVGGVTAYTSPQMEGPIKVLWPDMIEDKCLVYRARKMGPLVVAMDTKGGNLFEKVEEEKRQAIKVILGKAAGNR
jgi:tartrate dehydratase beta subunit/fumarate hydratase class I family protein